MLQIDRIQDICLCTVTNMLYNYFKDSIIASAFFKSSRRQSIIFCASKYGYSKIRNVYLEILPE